MRSFLNKHKRLIAAALAVVVILAILVPLFTRSAYADGITYDTDSYESGYSKSSSLAVKNISIPEQTGKKIKTAAIVDAAGTTIHTITEAAGKTSYSGKPDGMPVLWGKETPVYSNKNDQIYGGYYSWYRYSKGSKPNDQWYAVINRSDDGNVFWTETINGFSKDESGNPINDEFGMPVTPGVTDNNLWMKWTRSAGFFTTANFYLSTNAVSHEAGKLKVTAESLEGGDILGPDELHGPALSITPSEAHLAQDMDTLSVKFGYSFNHLPEPDAQKDLASYGAKVMSYHYKFTANIESVSYFYGDYRVETEYEPVGGSSPTPSSSVSATPTPKPTAAPVTDDLEVVSLTFSPATFTPRDEVTLQYVLKNNSQRPWRNFYYTVFGQEFQYTAFLAPGETYSGTLTRKFTSPQTLSVQIDSRNEIPEFDETNNEKSVYVSPGPMPDNHPPEGKLRWFDRWTQQEVTTVTEGTVVDLKYVDVDDPDGDSVSFKTHFAQASTEWMREVIHQRWQFEDTMEQFSAIDTTGGMGDHRISGTITDSYGGQITVTAYLSIIPPNPVAVISGPAVVVEGRPLPSSFSSAGSFSPLNRAINHDRDEWGNKQERYYTPGTEKITLKVWDDAGLPSLNTAAHQLIVRPDLPPVAVLSLPSKAVRTHATLMRNASYSPDGDAIVDRQVWVQYDSDNDGNFDEESLTPLGSDIILSPVFDQVGQYRAKVYAKEDWGKEASAYFYFEVVNDSPFVTFEMSSEITEPMIIPTYPVSLQLGDWTSTNLLGNTAVKNWKPNGDGSISTFEYKQKLTRTSDVSKSVIVSNKSPLLYSQQSYYVVGEDYFLYYAPQECYSEEDGGGCTGDYWAYYNPPSATYLRYGTPITVDVAADEIYFKKTYSHVAYAYTLRLSSIKTGTADVLREYEIGVIEEHPDIVNKPWYRHTKYGPSTLGYTYNSGPDSGGNVIWTGNNLMYNRLEKKSKSGELLWGKTHPPKIVPTTDEEGNPTTVYAYPIFSEPFYTSDFSKFYVMKTYSDYSSNPFDKVAGTYSVLLIDSATGETVKEREFYSPNAIRPSGVYNGNLIATDEWGMSSRGILSYNESLELSELHRFSGITAYMSSWPVRFSGDGFISYQFYYYGGSLSTRTVLYDLNNDSVFVSPDVRFRPWEKTIFGLNGSVENVASEEYTQYTDDDGNTSIGAKPYITTVQPYENRNTATSSQLINESLPSLSDVTINYKYKVEKGYANKQDASGFSFKIQDHKNMYRVLFHDSELKLVKIVNGATTVLGSTPYPFYENVYYSFKIKSFQNRHTIYVNGAPMLDVTDASIASGRFGPFAVMYNSYFKDISYQDLSGLSGSTITKDTVLVGNEILYAVTYEDAEHDPHPIDLTWWKFEQTNPWKFLDAGDGKSGWSGLNGYTHHGSLPSLDRVGVWRVTHWLKDDPHRGYPYPSMVFDAYRASSNTYSRDIIVHRKPVSRFALSINSSGMVLWNDTSYDPDRWLSASQYSTEAPAYASNRGIYSRKYKYVTPSGLEMAGKLTRPTESGVYTVSLAVMDEYGAWSDWYDQTITATIVLPPNNPPIVDFDSPLQVYRDDAFQLINRSYDPEGGAMSYSWTIMKPPYTNVFSTQTHPWLRIRDLGLGKAAVSPNWFIELTGTDSTGQSGTKTRPLMVVNHIPTTSINGPSAVLINQTHGYASGGWDLDSEDQWNLTYNWKVTAPNGTEASYSGSAINLTFSQGGTYKLEHWVLDPVGDRSSTAQLLVDVDNNLPPLPGFTIVPNPAYRWEPVAITSTASDPDGAIVKHEYWITRPDGSSFFWSNAADWSHGFDTVGKYSIRQRVEDNKGAAAEISQVLQVVNRLPTVELTTPSGPDIEHPSVNIPPFTAQWIYQDGDGDAQSWYRFVIRKADTRQVVLQTEAYQSVTGVPVGVGVLVAGQLYEAQVTVSDGYGTADSAPRYFVLNRPPVADFDWTPKPVWEGDLVTLFSTSTDPDGDELTFSWTIHNPDGGSFQGDQSSWDGVFLSPGIYEVTLTVSDGYESDQVRKPVEAQLLTIDGEVNHTPAWLEYHRQHGHETEIPPKEFYSGEKLLTMLTSAPAPVALAEAWLEAEGMNGNSIDLYASLLPVAEEPSRYGGELYDEILSSLTERLPNGEHTVSFRLTYANGVVKRQDVQIRIIGSVHQAVGVHRVQ
ncbi:MAG: hypothetical protein K0R57_3397 [Paenibacillaceae bacterium]|jgi:hypothetical protein|nr:hypothetical protein [Paenibacillaceae bacterium]